MFIKRPRWLHGLLWAEEEVQRHGITQAEYNHQKHSILMPSEDFDEGAADYFRYYRRNLEGGKGKSL